MYEMGRYLLLLFEYEYLLEYDLLSLLEKQIHGQNTSVYTNAE